MLYSVVVASDEARCDRESFDIFGLQVLGSREQAVSLTPVPCRERLPSDLDVAGHAQ